MIRFTNAPGTGFQIYDEGVYTFQIEKVEQGTSKNNNPQLTVKTRIVGGRYDGKPMTMWYSLVEAAAWKLTKLVEATGCDHTVVGHDAKGQPIIEFDEENLVGLTFEADVTIEQYNGKDTNRVNNERMSGDDALDPPAASTAPAPQAAAAQPAAAPAAAPQVQTGTLPQRRPRTVQA